MTVAHWDEVDWRHNAKGEMDATWQGLGNAAGTRGVGVNRVRVEPGKLPTPPHSHGASEEIYFVLAGSGLAWQGGEVYEVRPLDCVIQRPDEMEHTFVAGDHGLEYLVFGTRHPTELGGLPRSRANRFGWPGGGGAGGGPGHARTARGRSGRPSSRSPTGSPARDPRTSSTWTRSSSRPCATRHSPISRRTRGPSSPASAGRRSRPGIAAPSHTATRPRRRSSSSSRARRRSSSGRTRARSRRRRFVLDTSSRGRRERGSPTPSAPARTG